MITCIVQCRTTFFCNVILSIIELNFTPSHRFIGALNLLWTFTCEIFFETTDLWSSLLFSTLVILDKLLSSIWSFCNLYGYKIQCICSIYSNLFKSYHCLRIVIYYNVAINLLWLIKILQVWNLISRRTTHMAVDVFECFYLFYFLCTSTISWKKWYLI